MLKLLVLCAILAIVARSEEETIEISLVNYDAMYNNECASSSTSAASQSSAGSASSSAETGDEDEGASEYEHKYDKYYKNNEDEYAEKYGDEYQGESNPGSVKGNEIGSGHSSDESDESSTFCKCLEKVKESGKSYSEYQNEFSKCIDKANGNDASHWEKVAKRYERKYGVKMDSSESAKTTTAAPKAEGVAVADDADDAETQQVDADDADDVDGVQAGAVENDEDDDDDDDAEDAVLYAADRDDDRFGNAAIYLTFIGTSLLLFVCAWFVKDGLKKWKMRDYKNVSQQSSFESEAEADDAGNPYGGNDEDWDDNYNYNYSRNNKSEKKGKFASWNQYASV